MVIVFILWDIPIYLYMVYNKLYNAFVLVCGRVWFSVVHRMVILGMIRTWLMFTFENKAWHRRYDMISGPVDNLAYQFNNICNQLKPSRWAHLWGVFLDWIIYGEKTHSKSGSYFLVTAHINRHGEGEFLFFTYFPSLSLACSSILLPRHSFTSIKAYFFRTPMCSED